MHSAETYHLGPRSLAADAQVAVFSRGIARIPHLRELLGCQVVRFLPTADDVHAGLIDLVVGWGNRATAAPAQAFARTHGLPFLRLEDGLLRSVGLGVTGTPPLSLVLDDAGIYYAAGEPSRLEQLILESDTTSATELRRAAGAIQRIVDGHMSKYNDAPPMEPSLGPRTCPRVLVVDQTRGDKSVSDGLASDASFATMLAAAIDEHPDAEIIVKTHPDVLAGKRRGFLETVAHPRVRLWATPSSSIELARQVDHVYVVTSQLGFEALLAGTKVTCFGAPFYAGWGLTDDRCAVPRRSVARTVEQVFVAAYLQYPRYVDPDTGLACQLERILEHVELQRSMFAHNTGAIFGVGFLPWKRSYVRDYLRCPGNRVVFVRNAAQARKKGFGSGSKLLVLGHRDKPDLTELAGQHHAPVWRMEDGFLRSVGLGSNASRPASLVVDQVGIYYDPRSPSQLEQILSTATFTDAELARARALRETIVSSGVSKYNVGTESPVHVPDGKHVVLVPGQVEDDASIRTGTLGIRTNLALLEATRRAAPEAYIIYKPHPDVLAGNRRGSIALTAASAHCDHVETRATLARCLEVCHEVHTMTSLVGFEALLRGKRVVVYGQPFYGSWGLTDDVFPVSRRTRTLMLDELVAGTMLRYPRYVHPETRQFTTAETILALLGSQRLAPGAERTARVPAWRRNLRRLRNVLEELRHA